MIPFVSSYQDCYVYIYICIFFSFLKIILGAEMSYLSYPNSIMMLFSRTPKKIKNKIGEKQTEKTTTRDNSFETTINGE